MCLCLLCLCCVCCVVCAVLCAVWCVLCVALCVCVVLCGSASVLCVSVRSVLVPNAPVVIRRSALALKRVTEGIKGDVCRLNHLVMRQGVALSCRNENWRVSVGVLFVCVGEWVCFSVGLGWFCVRLYVPAS